jgi:hypothetical protein
MSGKKGLTRQQKRAFARSQAKIRHNEQQPLLPSDHTTPTAQAQLPWWRRLFLRPHPIPTPQRHLRENALAVLGSGILSLFVMLVFEYLSLRGVINMALAWATLGIAWLVGVCGIILSEIVWGQTLRNRITIGFVASALLGIALIALDRSISIIVGTSALTENSVVLRTQIDELDHLNAFLNVITRENFYLPVMVAENVARIKYNLQHDTPANQGATNRGEQVLLHSGSVSRRKYDLQTNIDNQSIELVTLPAAYTEMLQTLHDFTLSDKLPKEVIEPLEQLGSVPT